MATPHYKSMSCKQYTYNEIELAKVLEEIWANKISIDAKDLVTLKELSLKKLA
jgi:hypothetical protein